MIGTGWGRFELIVHLKHGEIAVRHCFNSRAKTARFFKRQYAFSEMIVTARSDGHIALSKTGWRSKPPEYRMAK